MVMVCWRARLGGIVFKLLETACLRAVVGAVGLLVTVQAEVSKEIHSGSIDIVAERKCEDVAAAVFQCYV